jgi:hypothetical protein
MAKRARRQAAKGKKSVPRGKRRASARRSAKGPNKKRQLKRSAARPKTRRRSKRQSAKTVRKVPHLDRARRTLEEQEVPTPPSSLNMNRRGSAARTGRAELNDNLHEHGGDMSPAITGGDVDADWEEAYFSGDEAPGGDNPTPDQEVVDDIGKALGVQYEDNEELKSSDKVVERDKHRWELDPASSEDYKDRK